MVTEFCKLFSLTVEWDWKRCNAASCAAASRLWTGSARIDKDNFRWYTQGYPQRCGTCPEGHGRDTRKRKAVGKRFRKEVKLMPIILTIHVFGLTVTVRIKRNSNNRHSAKWRLFELITRSFEWGQPLLAVSLFQLSLYWRQLILSRR